MSAHHLVMAGLAAALIGVPTYAEELPEDFDLITIPNRSDNRVNTSRIVCAAGRLAVAEKRVNEHFGIEIKAREAASFCPAIVAEAVKRGNQADLYSRMQPDKAADELQAVLVAAAGGKSHYENAVGVRKALNCELAFDVGYIYGHANGSIRNSVYEIQPMRVWWLTC